MKKTIGILLIIVSFYSCDTFFNKNIEDESIVVLAPPNNYSTSVRAITFWWEELEDANEYNLQIVSPDFTYIQQLILDTIVEYNKYDIVLSPGEYEWRIRGENAKSETDYVFGKLIITTSDTLTGQQVILLSPSNNFATNQSDVTFRWIKISNADDYLIEFRDQSGSLVGNPAVTSDDSVEFSFTSEDEFTWQVQARNNFSQTGFSERTIVIDQTNPAIPQLSSPPDDDTLVNGNVLFQWTRPIDNGSYVYDTIYIYSDSLITLFEKVEVDNKQYSTVVSNGTYFWRVRAVDVAGNTGDYSNTFRFTVP